MADSKVREMLDRAMADGSVLSVFTDCGGSQHMSAGFIECVSDEFVVLRHINKYGLYDGYGVRRIDAVSRIDYGSRYEQRLSALYSLRGQQHEALLENNSNAIPDLLKATLIQAKQKGYIISILLDSSDDGEEDMAGWVKEVCEDELVISMISFYGLADGESVIRLEDIAALHCDTEDEMALKLLYESINKAD